MSKWLKSIWNSTWHIWVISTTTQHMLVVIMMTIYVIEWRTISFYLHKNNAVSDEFRISDSSVIKPWYKFMYHIEKAYFHCYGTFKLTRNRTEQWVFLLKRLCMVCKSYVAHCLSHTMQSLFRRKTHCSVLFLVSLNVP